MKQILITKGSVIYGYNGVDDVDKVYSLLGNGALVAFADDGTYLDAATTELFKNFYFALGTQEGPIVTPLINYKTFAYHKVDYVAPVLPIKTLGTDADGDGRINWPASLTPYIGKSASIMLVDKRYAPNDKRREKYYSVPITATSTQTTILTALVAAITADPHKIVSVALYSTTGIIMTALYGDFEYVNMGGVFENTTVGTSGGSFQAYVKGQGTYADILALEKEFSPDRGNINSVMLNQELYHPTSQAVSDETYGVYVITWRAEPGVVNDTFNKEQTLIIAVPTSEDSATETEYVLDALLAVVNVAADAVS